MEMKVSDYIVDFLIQNDITDIFGYPGGMVTHLMDSLQKRKGEIEAHVNYHEQASAFAACGYAAISGKTGVTYATSGPGATNMITGICDAFFDSIPVIFLTGQVNTFESKGDLGVRQKGFQETDIVSMVCEVTKYCKYVETPEEVPYELEKAIYIANEGRKGPVLLDLPMNVLRGIIDPSKSAVFMPEEIKSDLSSKMESVAQEIEKARRPVLLLGAGVKDVSMRPIVRSFIEKYQIPTVTSMIASDLLDRENIYNYGFIGAYGNRCANFIVAKCDLLISVGSRLDVRQIGAKKENFAPNAKLIRVDIDEGELSNKVKPDELQIRSRGKEFFKAFEEKIPQMKDLSEGNGVCNEIRDMLGKEKNMHSNELMADLSGHILDHTVITTDVGQNQVWTAQSFAVKQNQAVLYSGGHGAMGYSLPAAIGAYYGSRKNVVSLNGDGGIQMNIQELQFIAREQLPITIVIFNNYALGMIRHFQEMYFEKQYFQTVESGGYSVPDFEKIGYGYGLPYYRIENKKDIEKVPWDSRKPQIVEVVLHEDTYVFPKLEFGKPNQDQEPLIDRNIFNHLMEL